MDDGNDAGDSAGARSTMRFRLFQWIVLAWLSVSASWAQEAPKAQSQATPQHTQSSLPDAPIAKTAEPDEKPPRLFWIIPTFTVSDSKTPLHFHREKSFAFF